MPHTLTYDLTSFTSSIVLRFMIPYFFAMESGGILYFEGNIKSMADFNLWKEEFEAACERSRQKAREEPPPQGFSSWEEHEKYFWECAAQADERAREREERIEEVARATGRTVKEVCKEWYSDQMDSTQSSIFGSGCTCEGK